MKKFFLFCTLFLVGTSVFAQNIDWFRATSFAYKFVGEDWSDWEKSSVKIKFDYNQDKITIFSDDVQIYKIISTVKAPYDSKGEQVKFYVIDQDGDYGHVRFRVMHSTLELQIYVDFSDVSWVYNVDPL